MAVDLAGNVSNQAGTAKVGLTVELWEKSAYEGSGSRTGSTTTDSQGNWAFTGQDITKLWLVVVVDGTKKVLPVHSEGSQQLTKLDLITDMNVDTINEHTAAAGVTIDSVVVKDGGLTTTGVVTVGSDGSGADVIFYSGTAGDNLTWDASEELLTITGTDGNTALNVADGNVTIADNLTVSGNLTVTGTTTSVDSTTINAATAFVFEGATADAHETTLGIVDPTADATINLPAMSVGTYYLPVLAAASTTSVSSTPAELNLLDALDRGSILYGNASSVTTVLGQGTADQVLTSDGADISWEDAAGGGGKLDLIATAVASGSASLTIGGLSDTYEQYLVTITDMNPATDGVAANFRVGDASGIDTGASDYTYHAQRATHEAGTYGTASTGNEASLIELGADVGNAAGESISAALWISRNDSGTFHISIHGTVRYSDADQRSKGGIIFGARIGSIELTQVQFYFGSGNIDTGQMTVYGLNPA